MDRLVTATVERTLTLKNEGAEPLTIERVQPSCGCTGAILSSTGGKQGEVML